MLELPEQGVYVATARLAGPGWNFVTVLPEKVVSSAAFQVARYVLLFGVMSLLIELGVMFWVLKQQISRPLVALHPGHGSGGGGQLQGLVADLSR